MVLYPRPALLTPGAGLFARDILWLYGACVVVAP